MTTSSSSNGSSIYLSCNWNKIEQVIYTQTLYFFIIFSFFTLCNLSSASILSLKVPTSYHICFVNSFLIWYCVHLFLLQLSPNSPMCTPLSNGGGTSSPQYPAIFSPSSILHWSCPLSGPYDLCCVENSRTDISTHPFPEALSYRKLLLESAQVPSVQLFLEHFTLQYPHKTSVLLVCWLYSHLPTSQGWTFEIMFDSTLTQLFSLCLHYQLYITKFCEFFHNIY